MKKVKSSTVSGGIFLISLVIVSDVIFRISGIHSDAIQSLDTAIALYLMELVPICFGVPMLRTYYLTPEGILHWIRYKITPWGEIANISRIIIPRDTILWITPKGQEILPIEPDGRILDKYINKFSWYSDGDYFSLFDKPEILDCIKEYYGPLDYDYKTDRTVF